MSTPETSPDAIYRCPHCDSVVDAQARVCLMCGQKLDPSALIVSTPAVSAESKPELELAPEPAPDEVPEPHPETPEGAPAESQEPTPAPAPVEAAVPETSEDSIESEEIEAEPEAPVKTAVPIEERIQKLPPIQRPAEAQSNRPNGWRPNFIMFVGLLFVVVIGLCGGLVAFQAEAMRSAPTPRPTRDTTAVAGLATATPTVPATATPAQTDTPVPTNTPAPTNTPLPTNTPQPPRFHTVETGDSLISISLRYGGITVDSIAEANSLDLNNPLIQAGQDIVIPWPTATPPLQPIVADVGEDKVLVDPSNCPPFYEISEGDTLFQLAAVNDVPLDAMLAINYLTIDSVLQPGDVICIPNVEIGGILPPTPGPSPTPSLTPPPAGPRLLYPAEGTTLENPEDMVALQWLVVQDLAPDEYYMVEVTNLTAVDSYPRRGFTRQTSFQVPAAWRATEDELHEFRWRVSIVRVTGQRDDGSFIYTYGGRASQDSSFFWQGAVPIATPTWTPTPTPTATFTPQPTP